MISNETIEKIKNTPAKTKREQAQKDKIVEVAERIAGGYEYWPAAYIIAEDIISPKAKYADGVDPVEMTAINAHALVAGGRSIDEALEILGIPVQD